MDVSTISWQFSFPESRDDLLVSETGKYSVGKIVPVHQISSNLDMVLDMVKKKARWSWWILEHFDTFFSVIMKFGSLDNAVKEDTWRAVVMGIEQHTETLARSFTNERLDSADKLAHLNSLQMEVYVLVELCNCFEDEGKSAHQIISTKRKGKKQKEDESSWTPTERQEGLHALRQLLDLNLALLWNPPIVHETFVENVASICYKLLENPEVPKCKKTAVFVFHVLGVLVKRYNHCLGACMKIVQLLQSHEYLSSTFASLMLVCVRDYDVKSVVAQVVREIAQIDPGELVRDTNATRNYCNFLLEVGNTCGPVILSVISSLMPHLDGDSYTMRNCVLTIIGDLIGGVLSAEGTEERDTRETLFDRLELHIHDQNAFVRSKSIQVLTKLIEQRIVPIPRQHSLVDKIVGSIQDKSSNVRKNALVFITTYLGCNPYSDKLSLERIREKLTDETGKLNKLKEELPTELQEVSTQASADSSQPPTEEETMETDTDPETLKKLEAVQKQDLIVQYLGDCVLFTEQMHKVILLVSQLLASKSASDILESIDFLVSAFEFGLKAAELGVRKMLVLVFNPDQHVKDAVVNAYIRLYVKPVSGKRCGPEAVARNLMSMTYGATLGELMSLRELVKLLLEKEHITPRAIKVLLDLLLDKTEATPSHELTAAILVLTMVAAEDHTLVAQNISLLITAGFDGDVELAKNTCNLLQQGVPAKKAEARAMVRLEETHKLVSTLTSQLILSFDQPGCDWVGFANEAVKTLYSLCEVPDTILSELLNKLLKKTFPPREGDLLDNVDNSPPTNNPLVGLHMYRLLNILGQTALSTLVHLDTRLLEELKYRASARQQMEEKKKMKRGRAGNTSSPNESTVVDAAEEELGMAGATADDAEAEHVRQVLEKEIVTGTGLLARFVPLLKHICSSPQLYPCHRIQNAAVMAMCKFMLVSSDLCEDNIQLLFTLLEKSNDEKTRCNIMILLHDLIIRFPNLLVNWTGKIYARLRDESAKVRSTTIRVLTNLILNDMVKVKGQISELAACLEDDDPKIRSLTKLFFVELSRKTNAIYNVMADIISHLSDPDAGRSQEQFQSIMRYLFEFIEKDKQAESLVEKLCHRFRATRSDRQWHDLSFCLSLLSYNEKSFKKLIENMACYHDKLADTQVYTNFNTIVEKGRKTVKNDELLDDYELKLRFCHNRGGGDEAPTEEILSQMKDLLIKAPPPPKQARGRGRAKKKTKGSESEDDQVTSPGSPAAARPKRSGRNPTKRRPPVSSEDSDDGLELPNIQNSAESSSDSEADFEASIRASQKPAKKGVSRQGKAEPRGRRVRR